MNYRFRVSGDRKHKFVRDLVLRGSRETVDILNPEVVRCRGQDMIFMTQRQTEEDIYEKLPNHTGFEQKKCLFQNL